MGERIGPSQGMRMAGDWARPTGTEFRQPRSAIATKVLPGLTRGSRSRACCRPLTVSVTLSFCTDAASDILRKRLSERAEGQLVERNTLPLTSYARHWLSVIAPANTSGKTRERYAELHCLKLGCGRFDLVFPTWTES